MFKVLDSVNLKNSLRWFSLVCEWIIFYFVNFCEKNCLIINPTSLTSLPLNLTWQDFRINFFVVGIGTFFQLIHETYFYDGQIRGKPLKNDWNTCEMMIVAYRSKYNVINQTEMLTKKHVIFSCCARRIDFTPLRAKNHLPQIIRWLHDRLISLSCAGAAKSRPWTPGSCNPRVLHTARCYVVIVSEILQIVSERGDSQFSVLHQLTYLVCFKMEEY